MAYDVLILRELEKISSLLREIRDILNRPPPESDSQDAYDHPETIYYPPLWQPPDGQTITLTPDTGDTYE